MNHQQVYRYGQSQGQASYSAPNSFKQQGPKVQGGHDKYDNYGKGGYQYEDKKHHGGCEKCCACLGATVCCCCVLDCLT